MLKDFSYLPKSDRVIFIILILSVVGLLAFLYLAGGNDNSSDIAAVDSLAHDATVRTNDTLQIPQAAKGGELFAFDPNTADSTQLTRLGLNKWQVKNIYKYRAAGGVYRQPSDFARLWGLTKKQFERLRPYIRISDDYKPAADFYGHTGWKEQSALPPSQQLDGNERPVYQRPLKLEEGQTINLNTADTTQLKMVPGIGSYFARQIVNYRKRLGGFSHTSTSTRPRPSSNTDGCAGPSKASHSYVPARISRRSRSVGWSPMWSTEWGGRKMSRHCSSFDK